MSQEDGDLIPVPTHRPIFIHEDDTAPRVSLREAMKMHDKRDLAAYRRFATHVRDAAHEHLDRTRHFEFQDITKVHAFKQQVLGELHTVKSVLNRRRPTPPPAAKNAASPRLAQNPTPPRRLVPCPELRGLSVYDEPGRPSIQSGMNLSGNHVEFNHFVSAMKTCVIDHLDTSKKLQEQSNEAKDNFYIAVRAAWPALDEYESLWPALFFATIYLIKQKRQ
ncbi:hypothetical protein C8T65DRAFT_746126 [Cerioporus squamosus]|nr:hypothetical protein C8T65DRAFT_746126 [Cerioporus squamosus]